MRESRSRQWCIGLSVAAIVLFTACLAQFYRRGTGFTSLIKFGDQFDARVLPIVRAEGRRYIYYESPGYDGQFYAQLAVDPLLRDRAIDQALDNPPFRGRRILFAWTAHLLGLGRPAWVLRAYALQNIFAWFFLAWILTTWLPPVTPRRLAAWLGRLFGAGVIASVLSALLEVPSLVLLALAVLALERGYVWGAGVVMGLAGLGRETNLLGGGLLIERVPRTLASALHLAGVLAVAALPYVVWSLYIRSLYPAFSFSNPDSFSLPFEGYFGEWVIAIQDCVARNWDPASRSCIYSLVSLTIQTGFLVWYREWRSPWWRMGIAYVCFLPFLSPLIWAGFPGAAVRVLVPMTIAFNVLALRISSGWFWPLIALGNFTVLKGLHDLQIPAHFGMVVRSD